VPLRAGGLQQFELKEHPAAQPRGQIGFCPWRFVGGEASIGRCVVFADDDEYEELLARKECMPETRFSDANDPKHVEKLDKIAARNLEGHRPLRTLLRD
jgi:hypothetical protein